MEDEARLRPPPRSRHRGLLTLAGILFLLGASLQISHALVLAGTLLVLLCLAYLWCVRSIQGVECVRTVYHGACEGESVRVRVEVRNHGDLPVFCPEIGDHFGPDRTPLHEVLAPVRLDPGKAAALAYTAHCFRRRGTYPLGPMFVRVSDPLGLFLIEKRIEAPLEFSVYPGTFEIPHLPLAGAREVFAAGADTAPRPGQGQLYMGTREYREGDETRNVDWRASARRGRTIVKEFETEVEPEVTLLLDLDAAHAQGMGQRSTLEAGVKIVASLAMRITADRAYVQFAALDSRYQYVPFGTGEGHLMRILDVLVHVRQDGGTAFPEFLAFTRELIRPHSTVFLVFTSTRIDPAALSPIFAAYRGRGARCTAIVLDDASFVQWREQVDWKAAAAERDRTLAWLAAEGCTVIPVDAQRPLDEAFRQAGLQAEEIARLRGEPRAVAPGGREFWS